MPILSSTPSVGQVVASLNRSAAPASIQTGAPRFSPLSVLLSLLAVALLTAFLILSWHLVRQCETLVRDIRDHRARQTAQMRSPAISEDRILDPRTFALELAATPQQAVALHLARARLLARRGDENGADRGYADVHRLDPRRLSIDDRLSWAGILAKAGDRERAMNLLHGLDGTTLDDGRRQRLTRILLDMLINRRQEAGGTTMGRSGTTGQRPLGDDTASLRSR